MAIRNYIPAILVTAGMLGVTGMAITHAASPATGQAMQQQAISEQDKDFVQDAAQSNLAKIKLSQMALQKSQNPQIRDMANQMVQGYTKANAELNQLAMRLGVSIPQSQDVMDKASATGLSMRSGEDFDKAFLDEMRDEHQDAVDKYKKEASEGTNPQVRQYASTYLSKLENNLAYLEQAPMGQNQPTSTASQSGMQSGTNQQTEGRSTVRGYW